MQARNGAVSLDQRQTIQQEANELTAAIGHFVSSTEFNGLTLLDGSFDQSIQVGVDSGDQLQLTIDNAAASVLGSTTGGTSGRYRVEFNPIVGVGSSIGNALAASNLADQTLTIARGDETRTLDISTALGNKTADAIVAGIRSLGIEYVSASSDRTNAYVREVTRSSAGGLEGVSTTAGDRVDFTIGLSSDTGPSATGSYFVGETEEISRANFQAALASAVTSLADPNLSLAYDASTGYAQITHDGGEHIALRLSNYQDNAAVVMENLNALAGTRVRLDANGRSVIAEANLGISAFESVADYSWDTGDGSSIAVAGNSPAGFTAENLQYATQATIQNFINDFGEQMSFDVGTGPLDMQTISFTAAGTANQRGNANALATSLRAAGYSVDSAALSGGQVNFWHNDNRAIEIDSFSGQPTRSILRNFANQAGETISFDLGTSPADAQNISFVGTGNSDQAGNANALATALMAQGYNVDAGLLASGRVEFWRNDSSNIYLENYGGSDTAARSVVDNFVNHAGETVSLDIGGSAGSTQPVSFVGTGTGDQQGNANALAAALGAQGYSVDAGQLAAGRVVFWRAGDSTTLLENYTGAPTAAIVDSFTNQAGETISLEVGTNAGNAQTISFTATGTADQAGNANALGAALSAAGYSVDAGPLAAGRVAFSRSDQQDLFVQNYRGSNTEAVLDNFVNLAGETISFDLGSSPADLQTISFTATGSADQVGNATALGAALSARGYSVDATQLAAGRVVFSRSDQQDVFIDNYAGSDIADSELDLLAGNGASGFTPLSEAAATSGTITNDVTALNFNAGVGATGGNGLADGGTTTTAVSDDVSGFDLAADTGTVGSATIADGAATTGTTTNTASWMLVESGIGSTGGSSLSDGTGGTTTATISDQTTRLSVIAGIGSTGSATLGDGAGTTSATISAVGAALTIDVRASELGTAVNGGAGTVTLNNPLQQATATVINAGPSPGQKGIVDWLGSSPTPLQLVTGSGNWAVAGAPGQIEIDANLSEPWHITSSLDGLTPGGGGLLHSAANTDANLDYYVRSSSAPTGPLQIEFNGFSNQVGENIRFSIDGNTVDFVGAGANQNANAVALRDALQSEGYAAQLNGTNDGVIVSKTDERHFSVGAYRSLDGLNSSMIMNDGDYDLSVDTSTAGQLSVRDTSLIALSQLDYTTNAGLDTALDSISAALNQISNIRGDIGAMENRFQHVTNQLGIQHTNLKAAQSRIEDTNVAREAMILAGNQIIQQAGLSAMTQLHRIGEEMILQLIQN